MSKVRRIYRSEHNSSNHFFILTRDSMQNARLSFEARGVLAYLLSKPDDWELMPEDIASQGNIGKNKAYRIIKELMEHGYITRTMHRNEKKQIIRVDYQVFEKPLPQNQEIGLQETGFGDSIHIRDKDIKENNKSSDDLINLPASEDEPLDDKSKLHRAYFQAFARALTAMEEGLLEDYPVEDVLQAIQKAKQHQPKSPARYIKSLLDNVVTIPDHLKRHYNVWRASAFTPLPTKTPPPYDPRQDDVARLDKLSGMCSYDELFQFLTEKKQDAFWQDKVIALKFIQDNISAWKGNQ